MTRPGALKTGGFLVLEILIAGLILTSGIAATMYLFRMGFEHLERAKISNTLSAKLIQASGLIRTLDLQKKKRNGRYGRRGQTYVGSPPAFFDTADRSLRCGKDFFFPS